LFLAQLIRSFIDYHYSTVFILLNFSECFLLFFGLLLLQSLSVCLMLHGLSVMFLTKFLASLFWGCCFFFFFLYFSNVDPLMAALGTCPALRAACCHGVPLKLGLSLRSLIHFCLPLKFFFVSLVLLSFSLVMFFLVS